MDLFILLNAHLHFTMRRLEKERVWTENTCTKCTGVPVGTLVRTVHLFSVIFLFTTPAFAAAQSP